MSTKVTGIEREPFEYFDIAFLGYNAKLTNYGFRQFLENNREQVRAVYFESLIIILKDGTRLKAIPIVDDRHLGGYRFDQLILFDDNRWLIEWERSEDIRIIKALTMQLSNVPEEFQILKYEDIR
ncbi:hypothetical protein [Tissierella pigra]|uniref:Uncharacterized protein n=1 Tax=Tissierella pigra TaxID=2607614 RepID=A0A6N7Y1L8_9FIRM|nr:hypothetical protein [Tissierella pigra]MSU01900.1 hypothetical protein [Tissierella pigra]